MNICSLGVIGTRYVRPGEEQLPSEINIFLGESESIDLPDIVSEIVIGTKL